MIVFPVVELLIYQTFDKMEIVIFALLVILIVLNVALIARVFNLRQYTSNFKHQTENNLNLIVEELVKNRDILVKYRDNVYKNADDIKNNLNIIKRNQAETIKTIANFIDSFIKGSATVELSDADIDKLAAKLKPAKKTSKSKLNKATSDDKK